jgi:carboxyl-terminal processing protease
MKIRFRKNIIVASVVGLGLTLFSFSQQGDRFFEIAKNLDIFASLFKDLNTYYVDEINPNKAIKTSIDALLKTYDPYTVFYPEDDIEDFMTMTSGKYNGIGVITTVRDGKTLVMAIEETSPADKAGLRLGDEIVKIDGVDFKARNMEPSKLMKGQTGTAVKLSVKRYGQEKLEEIAVNRDVIKLKNVPFYGMVNEEVGYIDLKDFNATASKEMRDAFSTLKAKGMKRLIIDLRDNPGGLLNMAVDICNMFVPKESEIVSTKGKLTEWNKTYTALNPSVDTEMPIAVITNSRSASAAEIVSGVLQDYDRAVVVGQRSFGKGLVQVTRDLSYNTKFKVTTAKYYIPSGRCIQAIDYAHRNPDGSVGKTPDSLKTAFKTKSGRLVYDGGGIAPDVDVEKAVYSTATQSLVGKLILFDYANKYRFEHPSINPAKDFSLNDTDYQAFVKWAMAQKFDYTTQIEKDLETLEASSKKEKVYDAVAEQLKSLKAKMSHSKESDLTRLKDEIKPLLEQQIVMHYYLQNGLREYNFARDNEIRAALKVVSDDARYKSILKK